MRNALKWSAFVLLCVALATVSAFAQTTGGGLQGKVTDEKGEPVIGATIQITGPSMPGFQGAATDINGDYRIPYLPVGKNYQVKVEAQGFGTQIRQGIEIPLGVTVNLPFKMAGGTTTVTVLGVAPIIDSRKTEAGAVISDTMINNIPLGRGSGNIAYLAPSVVLSGAEGDGGGPAIGGASGLENSVTVNGIEMTNSGNAESFSALNFEFIEATEVKTGGLDAEYGGLMGGQINSITKSGGNEFHGGLYTYYFSDALQAHSRLLYGAETTADRSFKQYDIGGFIGGYIVKDKLWFFASYDLNKFETITDNYQYESGRLSINGQPLRGWANGMDFKSTVDDPQYALKMTWNISQNHKLGMSFFGDESKSKYWGFLAGLSSVPSGLQDKQNNYAVSFQWNATWTDKFFTEAIVGTRRSWIGVQNPTNAIASTNYEYYYRYGSDFVIPYDFATDTAPIWSGSTAHANLQGVVSPSLGSGYYQNEKDYNDQLRLKATNIINVGKAGKIELSYGLQRFDVKYDRLQSYSGVPYLCSSEYDPFYGQWSSRGAAIRWQHSPWDFDGNGTNNNDYIYLTYRSHLNDNNKKTKQTYQALWAQNNWSLTDNFMLKLGLRWDSITLKGGANLALIPNEIGGPGSGVYGVGTVQQTAGRSIKISNEWAPRVGFTWDPLKNGKSKVYGFYGWYYERIPNDMAIRALTTEWGHNAYFTDPYLTVSMDSLVGGGYDRTTGMDETIVTGGPNGGSLKGSFNKETLLGFQYEIMPNLTMGVRAIYREIGRVIEDISVDGANQYIVTNPDAWTGVWVPDYFTGETKWRFPKPVRRYVALELTVDKRFSNNWQMGGSYVLSQLQGNYDGLFSSANGQVDANITSSFDLPQLLVNGYGLLSNDRPQVLKLYGGYTFDWGLDLSARFTLQSGTPINKYGSDELYGQNEAFCVNRGSAGRLPMLWTLDLGVQYNVKLFKTNLGFRVDIFNATNEQRTTSVDQLFNELDNNPNPTPTTGLNPFWGYETSHQTPRNIRLAVRWTF